MASTNPTGERVEDLGRQGQAATRCASRSLDGGSLRAFGVAMPGRVNLLHAAAGFNWIASPRTGRTDSRKKKIASGEEGETPSTRQAGRPEGLARERFGMNQQHPTPHRRARKAKERL